MILYPSREFIVQNGVPRTRTCRRGAGSSSSRSGTRSRSLVGASAKPRCRQREKTVWMGYRSVVCGPAVFLFVDRNASQRRAREYRAEEKRKSNNRREKWARFESGYETEHRRITVGEILSAVPLTRSAEKCARQRQIQFWITLPMGNSWPRTLWRTESYGFGGEWKNSVWITIILKTSLILRENLKLGEITLSDILDHCLITKYRASIFIYIHIARSINRNMYTKGEQHNTGIS